MLRRMRYAVLLSAIATGYWAAAAAPAAARAPTRLWYKLEVRYHARYTNTFSESSTDGSDTKTAFHELAWTGFSDGSVLVRLDGHGFDILHGTLEMFRDVDQGSWAEDSTTAIPPNPNIPGDNGIAGTCKYVNTATIMGQPAFASLYISDSAVDGFGLPTISSPVVVTQHIAQTHTGNINCGMADGSWTDTFDDQAPWTLAFPPGTPSLTDGNIVTFTKRHRFGRRHIALHRRTPFNVMYPYGTRGQQTLTGLLELDVRLTRCPGTAPC
jgi:hypothetical protein